MLKVLNAIVDFFQMVIQFVIMMINGLMTLFQMLLVGVPSVLEAVASMPGFVVGGVTVTVSICLCMVLLGRRSS